MSRALYEFKCGVRDSITGVLIEFLTLALSSRNKCVKIKLDDEYAIPSETRFECVLFINVLLSKHFYTRTIAYDSFLVPHTPLTTLGIRLKSVSL